MARTDELEPVVIEVLLDPQIRQACAPYLQPWHFQRNIFKYMIAAITHKDFIDRPIDIKVLRLFMQSNHRDIYSEDWKLVEELVAKYTPVPTRDVESVTSII